MRGLPAAAALSVASLVAAASEPLLHPSQLEEDAREALADTMPGSAAWEVRSHGYVAGGDSTAFAVCGRVASETSMTRFALFYGLTEAGETLVRLGAPIIYGDYGDAGPEVPLARLARDFCAGFQPQRGRTHLTLHMLE